MFLYTFWYLKRLSILHVGLYNTWKVSFPDFAKPDKGLEASTAASPPPGKTQGEVKGLTACVTRVIFPVLYDPKMTGEAVKEETKKDEQ